MRQTSLLVSLLCILPALVVRADDDGPRKVALLVGVNRYMKPGFKDLKFAESDVRAVGAELEKLGFEVTTLLGSESGRQQATLANIEAAAHTMVRPLTKRDIALVMLSGHGQQLNPFTDADPAKVEFQKLQSYYCPVDALINRPGTQFSLSHLLDDILAPNVGTKLLLVDACRDVPLDRTRGGRNAKGIEGRVVALPEDTGVFFSCRAGQMSFERPELGHGLFTYCLLDGLRGKAAREGEIAWADLIAHVNRRMVQEDVLKLLPESLRQQPIPAGAVPHTVLGKLSGGGARSTPTPTPQPQRDQPKAFVNSAGLQMQPIPGGSFQMGSSRTDPSYRSDEALHTVRISRDFYISAHEVTRGQFRSFVDSERYRTEAERDGRGGWGFDAVHGAVGVTGRQYTWLNPGYTQTESHPVVNVSYGDAVAFCRWLSVEEDRTYRLPTEAEWEYACRGGTQTRYAGGDSDSAVRSMGNVADRSLAAKSRMAAQWAQSWDDGYAFTAPVGAFQPNAWGLYDMHGNVWEWVQDLYAANYYSQSPPVDPPGPARGEYRLFRGGGWFNPPPICRSANRNVLTPADRTNLIGFRVVAEQ